ncbi:hypothetical protein [Mycobacteroides immunogenum]|uniref:Uncharacterized protein n=1 Tax=Mycobacteroides immunogenum TaxID=83262 RepID=A0A7V8LLP7_9MYCO|nr:hypothetical protein [Mycobacteroides immunogenum]AMT69859.1 hypothetical protein ABG82_05420 [Mycobacteroides immunogenum]ANO02908.1 hypothetical protein BAB75_05440 [Mycobacteroides immunogenum]KIU39324.1 hypothetical protein TL11_17870 [Mycobacteroides immunogenum]KPG03175.1 hypothetical protein AN910_26630 [Mycobacteroides immunogenum]KPG05386.1 hypothetical protein AN909_20405 [Mycobacteroides immunogenum]
MTETLGIQSELAEEQQAAINRTNVKKLLGIARPDRNGISDGAGSASLGTPCSAAVCDCTVSDDGD